MIASTRRNTALSNGTVRRKLAICRKCSDFDESKKLGVMICMATMEPVTPNSRSEVYEEQRVPKCCPYMVEHFMTELDDESKNGKPDGCEFQMEHYIVELSNEQKNQEKA